MYGGIVLGERSRHGYTFSDDNTAALMDSQNLSLSYTWWRCTFQSFVRNRAGILRQDQTRSVLFETDLEFSDIS